MKKTEKMNKLAEKINVLVIKEFRGEWMHVVSVVEGNKLTVYIQPGRGGLRA